MKVMDVLLEGNGFGLESCDKDAPDLRKLISVKYNSNRKRILSE